MAKWLTIGLVSVITLLRGVSLQAPAPDDVEQRLGPFTFAGQTYSVVLYGKRLAGVQTLVRLEIRDTADTVQYQKTFPSEIQGDRFRQTVSAAAQLVVGQGLAGLAIRYRKGPAGPGAGESWQIFRSRNGRLGLLDPPISTTNANGLRTAATVRGAAAAYPNVRPELVELPVWTGNFYVIVPMQVDWRLGRTMNGQQCLEMSARGDGSLTETGCEMRVQARRMPATSEFTLIRLFPEPNEDAGPEHVVLAKDAPVEYLSARALVRWSAIGDEYAVTLEDVWLKILADNSEDKLGWIHSADDFTAVGLPTGNPTP